MTNLWAKPAALLTAEAQGWTGVWSLVFAAGHAAGSLAEVPGADDDLGLIYGALDTSFALTELEQVLVDFSSIGPAIHLEPVDLAERSEAVAVIAELLAAAESLTTALSNEADVESPVVLCATRVLLLLASARAKVTGDAW